ncbi:MAG: hypothetical protein HY597_07260 [Candidatus Omnitrophica bacterium]|nr:hypothetical protein [Candidatus Omnitrophota bacterium]
MIAGLFAVVGSLSQTGCAVFMAAKQPRKMDLSVLKQGTPRSTLLAELGQPVASETRGGKKVDVFSFRQGYSKPTKAARAVFHGAADVFTLGLWEIVGTPTEAVFDGTKMSLEVTYDQDDRVANIVDLQKRQLQEAPTKSTAP